MMSLTLLTVFSFHFTLVPCALMELDKSTLTLPQSVLDDIQKAVKCRRIPGLAVSVVFQGQDVLSTGFGYADVEKHTPVKGSTKFFIGSVTKSFTAVLLGMLLAESKYVKVWDTLITDIMGPDFELIDGRQQWATVRDVVSHRMGLRSYTLALMLGLDDRHSDMELCSRFRFINSSSFNSFRNKFEYSNLMFVLAGCLIEVIGKQSFETLLHKRILEPLGMKDTQLVTSTNLYLLNDLARPYYINEYDKELYPLSMDTLKCLFSLRPAGGVISTAEDMKKWMHFLMNQARDSQGRRLIPLDVLNEMFVGQIPMPKDHRPVIVENFRILDSRDDYGLGFILGYYRGHSKTFHTGRIVGYDTRMTLLPDARLGIFSACNGPASLNFQIHQVVQYMITDALLNLTTWLNESTACTFPKPWSQLDSEERGKLASAGRKENFLESRHALYTGHFGHLLFGNFTVSYNDSQDTLRFSYGLLGMGLLDFSNGLKWLMRIEGPMEYITVSNSGFMNRSLVVVFRDPDLDTGRYQKLVVEAFEENNPPVFQRDLKWSDGLSSSFSIHFLGKESWLLSVLAVIKHLTRVLYY